MAEWLSLIPWNLRELFSLRKKLALKNAICLANVVQDRAREDEFPQFGSSYSSGKETFHLVENHAGRRENSLRVIQQGYRLNNLAVFFAL